MSVSVDEWFDITSGDPCPLCGRRMTRQRSGRCRGTDATRDHIDPLAFGGRNCAENITAVCSRCNGDKGASTLLELLSGIDIGGGARIVHAQRMISATTNLFGSDVMSRTNGRPRRIRRGLFLAAHRDGILAAVVACMPRKYKNLDSAKRSVSKSTHVEILVAREIDCAVRELEAKSMATFDLSTTTRRTICP